MTEVRLATSGDFDGLPEIERAGDDTFADVGIVGMPGPATVEQLRAAAAVLVVGSPPVGFARIDLIEGDAHLEQLSVHPSAMRRGHGTALLDAAVAWAGEQGHHAITLATFRDVAWNMPFYARHGFVEVEPDTPALRVVAQHERDLDMQSFGERVLMRRTLRS